jgi:hypothetical protein
MRERLDWTCSEREYEEECGDGYGCGEGGFRHRQSMHMRIRRVSRPSVIDVISSLPARVEEINHPSGCSCRDEPQRGQL